MNGGSVTTELDATGAAASPINFNNCIEVNCGAKSYSNTGSGIVATGCQYFAPYGTGLTGSSNSAYGLDVQGGGYYLATGASVAGTTNEFRCGSVATTWDNLATVGTYLDKGTAITVVGGGSGVRSAEAWTYDGTETHNGQASFAGRILEYGYFHRIIASGNEAITAAGTIQGDATALVGGYLFIVTTAGANTGVRLPLGIAGAGGVTHCIINRGANTVKVWPGVGDKIITAAGTDLGTDANDTITANSTKIYQASDDGDRWFQISA